jgi:hypothetical protein
MEKALMQMENKTQEDFKERQNVAEKGYYL